MSDGGLLQKATNQRSDNDATNELVAATIIPNSQDSDMSSLKDVAITLSYGAVLPFFVVMWFGVYLDFISLTILSPLVMISSLAFVWWKLNLGLPAFAGGNGLDMKKSFAIFSTYILLLGIPLLLATLLVGDISLGDVSFDYSGVELEV